jgi:hypothetical protein
MKKIILIFCVILAGCSPDISYNNCVVNRTYNYSSFVKYRYEATVFCEIGIFNLYTDSLYTVGDTIKFIK